MTFKSIRDNIVLLATTFSRKVKSSPNISPNTNLKIEYIRIFNKIYRYPFYKDFMGIYGTLWDQFLTEGVGFEPTVPLQTR